MKLPQDHRMNPTVGSSLFSGVQFYLTGSPQSHTVPLLVERGGRSLSYLSGLATHCIAATQPEYNEMAEAEELLDVPVVTEEWVTSSARCGHLLPVRGFSTSVSQLFSGVTLVMDWDTLGKEDCEKIWAMFTWYGGKVGKKEKNGTHLMMGKGEDKQIKRGVKMMVTPDWVVDSVRDGVRKNEEEYHPSWLKKVTNEKKNGQNFRNERFSLQEASTGKDELSESESNILKVRKEGVESSLDNADKSVVVKVIIPNTSWVNLQTPPYSPNTSTVSITHQDDDTESSQGTFYCSAASSIHKEEDDTPSDYFSQDMESTEEEMNCEKRKTTEPEDDLNSSIEDMFAQSPVKKRKASEGRQSSPPSVLSPGSSRWSKTDKFRTAYSRVEAQALINFFMEQGVYFLRGGNQIWKVVEKAWICPGRSWQSLKHFFLKYLVKQLESYGVTEEEMKCKASSNEEGELFGTGERREKVEIVTSFYTMVEDRKILNYIMDHGRVEGMSAGGNRIWKMMEKKTVVVGRSWQSMKQRFRKNISAYLDSYHLSGQE